MMDKVLVYTSNVPEDYNKLVALMEHDGCLVDFDGCGEGGYWLIIEIVSQSPFNNEDGWRYKVYGKLVIPTKHNLIVRFP
jgi:hypothetical protein